MATCEGCCHLTGAMLNLAAEAADRAQIATLQVLDVHLPSPRLTVIEISMQLVSSPPSQFNGRVSDKPRRLPRHQLAQAHTNTHYRQPLSFMYWLCSKQNCLLCAYEHDFGDNYIIAIV
jgi:hypothetical protein